MRALDLSLIGDGGRAALLDRMGAIQWCCMPRLDGPPLIERLLSGRSRWSFGTLDLRGRSQRLPERAPVVITTHRGTSGSYEVVDFFPWRGPGRADRCLVRLLRPLEGAPKVRMSFRPSSRWGEELPAMSRIPSGVVFDADWSLYQLHASADARLYTLLAGGAMALTAPVAFVLSQEPAPADITGYAQAALAETTAAWGAWLAGLALPERWSEACVRSAVALKLCTDEDTGGIVAGLTTSIPRVGRGDRTRDSRRCWLRDGAAVAREMARLGANEVVTGWQRWLSSVLARDGAALLASYDLDGFGDRAAQIAGGLPGYRGQGPVWVGGGAVAPAWQDAWGDALEALALPADGAPPEVLGALSEAAGGCSWTPATLCLIEALARTGQRDQAESLFEALLASRGAGGLLSEDRDSITGEPWGDLPHARSHVGVLTCARLLS